MADLKYLDDIADQMLTRGNYRARQGRKIGDQSRNILGKKQPFAAAKRSKKKPITLAGQDKDDA